ncbi:MAG: hypothetical protein BGO76_08185 [Caedibacter sp. 38-128]|nr:SagB/ThcOx family dehydrogenase [Holosporales bacterium]OJX04113.1 MAG: hypothetical protein BGO76_08185 [Caedibacter sp. 38-128]
MYVNPHIFFFLKDGDIIAWDYKNHQQFALEKLYFERLVDWAKGNELDPMSIDQELVEGALLCAQQPLKEEWGWDVLAQIYHIGTRDIATNLGELDPQQWSKEYLEYCQGISQDAPEFHTKREGTVIELPSPDLSLLKNQNFLDVIKARKTCRSFTGEPVTLEYLSTLLYVSLGPLHDKWQDLEDNNLMVLGTRKAFPSGGGIHPEEAYIVAFNVEGLEPGVYHYDDQQHSLTLIKKGEFEKQVIELLLGQFFAKGLAFGIFLTSRFDKIWWKYPHSRAYRVALLDIGHASQTTLLTATALGLQTWLTGAFYDSKIEEFLEIKTSAESSIFFIGVGHGDNQSIPPEILKILQGEE